MIVLRPIDGIIEWTRRSPHAARDDYDPGDRWRPDAVVTRRRAGSHNGGASPIPR